MMSKRSETHKPEQIVAKLRNEDAMLNAGKDLAALLQALGTSKAMLTRGRAQYGGMAVQEGDAFQGSQAEENGHNARDWELSPDP